LAGLGYAALLYWRSTAFTAVWRLVLAIVRGVLVSVIAFLLLNPFVRMIENKAIKPLLVLIADDSESMQMGKTELQTAEQYAQFEKLKEKLTTQDVDVVMRTLQGDKKDGAIVAKHPITNLSDALQQVNSDFEGRNLAGVVLLTDGIVTEGMSPESGTYPFPVYTLGSGDTIPKKDVVLKSVSCNRIAYAGNKTPLEVNLQQYGFAGNTVAIKVKEGNNLLASKVVTLGTGAMQVESFIIDAGKAGLRHLEVEVTPSKGEFSLRNNSAHAYIEVIESKEKILILAAAPHPDIKVLRNALESALNYEVTLCVGGIDSYKPDAYDAVILHHLPDNISTFGGILEDISSKYACWFITGNNTRLERFNSLNGLLRMNSLSANADKVGAKFNAEFDLFTWSAEGINLLDKYPPLDVPFGNYQVSPAAKVVLQQMVGNTANGKPILLLGTPNTTRQAVWVGEDIWSWSMQEFNLNSNHNSLNELIRKTCQFLSTREDKRRLRVQPVAKEFSEIERISFEAESYNQIYEKVYGAKVQLAINDAKGKTRPYTFITNDNSSRLDIGTLPAGIYNYKAEGEVNGKKETLSGQFIVRSFDLETTSTTANWGMLRELSKRTNGQFLEASAMATLPAMLSKEKPKTLLQSSESTKELIDVKILFFVLLALASIEWIARKWLGGV